jgi:membrane-bound inhibitor of C-type lysozyme
MDKMKLTGFIAGSILVLGSYGALAQEATEPATPPSAPAPAVSTSLSLSIDTLGDIERKSVVYQCDDGAALRVSYVNASPNFLAILPVEGETYIFVTSLSASGARYVAGPYEWWSTGDEGTLRDLRAEEDEPPLATCLAASATP